MPMNVPNVLQLLDTTQYATWAWNTELALTYLGLWEAVTGTEQDSGKLLRAFTYLKMGLSDRFMSVAKDATSAKELWAMVKDRVQGNAKHYLNNLRFQVASFKYESTDTADSYIGRAKDLLRNLRDAGDQSTTEADIVMIVVNRLPVLYDSLRLVLMMNDSNTVDLNYVLSKLKIEEDRTQKAGESDPLALVAKLIPEEDKKDFTAYMAYAKRQRTEGSADRYRRENIHGQQTRETDSDRNRDKRFPDRQNPNRQQAPYYTAGRSVQRQQDSPRQETRECYNCRKIGHIARDCPDKDRRAYVAAGDRAQDLSQDFDPVLGQQL